MLRKLFQADAFLRQLYLRPKQVAAYRRLPLPHWRRRQRRLKPDARVTLPPKQRLHRLALRPVVALGAARRLPPPLPAV